MNTDRALLWVLVHFWGPCLWVMILLTARQWFDISFQCLVSELFKWSGLPAVCVPTMGVSLDTEPSPLGLWPMLTCHPQCFMSIDVGPLWVRGDLPHQHNRTPPRESWQGVRMGSSSQELYCKHLIFFPTVVIYSSFHANGIIWSMNVLRKGKRGRKRVKAHSYKWVGIFTTFSPESNLSAIHTGYETGRSELWLNYT